jgi:hypothetical protein
MSWGETNGGFQMGCNGSFNAKFTSRIDCHPIAPLELQERNPAVRVPISLL